MKKIIALLLALTLLTVCFGCKKAPDVENEVNISEDGNTGTIGAHSFTVTSEVTNYLKMDVEGFGVVLLELSPKDAPKTVANFQKLVAEGFYNGLTFHRVEKGFVIQGGDPKGDGTGHTDPIKGEFAANGVANTLSHKRGVLSMARAKDPNSGSCQFFICLDTPACTYNLDGKYASFGWVLEGMDVIDKIENVETYSNGDIRMPKEKIVIRSIVFVNVADA